jgi:hypothetical protein
MKTAWAFAINLNTGKNYLITENLRKSLAWCGERRMQPFLILQTISFNQSISNDLMISTFSEISVSKLLSTIFKKGEKN